VLRRTLRDFRPDVVHVRMFLTQLSPRILPLLAGVPALLHVGNYQTICPVNTRVLPDGAPCRYRAGRECHRQGCVSLAGLARTTVQLGAWRRWRQVFRMVVANSEALARTLRENGVDVDLVIRNGTQPVPARPALADPPTIAFAGRMMPMKGLDDLLRAMAIVVRQRPDVRLEVFGDGPDRARTEVLVTALGLSRSVVLHGHVARPALDERLAPAWVQAVPSRYREPGANVTPEAMMRGTAVVATDTGGTPEVVRDGLTGFLVPAGAPEVLADRLLRLVADRALAERLGAAARQAALAGLTVDHMLDRFEEVYRRLRS
jgi:glycosyltransferase involved in cell wall biosynthesis